jgi:hypothetical protein
LQPPLRECPFDDPQEEIAAVKNKAKAKNKIIFRNIDTKILTFRVNT